MATPPPGKVIGLARLIEGCDVGMISVGIVAKVIQPNVGPEIVSVPTVEFWLAVSLGQPSPLDGSLHIEDVLLRMVGGTTSQSLIDAFNAQKEAKRTPLVSVP